MKSHVGLTFCRISFGHSCGFLSRVLTKWYVKYSELSEGIHFFYLYEKYMCVYAYFQKLVLPCFSGVQKVNELIGVEDGNAFFDLDKDNICVYMHIFQTLVRPCVSGAKKVVRELLGVEEGNTFLAECFGPDGDSEDSDLGVCEWEREREEQRDREFESVCVLARCRLLSLSPVVARSLSLSFSSSHFLTLCPFCSLSLFSYFSFYFPHTFSRSRSRALSRALSRSRARSLTLDLALSTSCSLSFN